MRLSLAALLIAATPAPAQPEPTVRVGSWNIEWLGQPEKRHSKHDQKPEDIAKYIKSSGVQVLALNEICATTTEGPLRNANLDQAFEWLWKETQQDWQYVLFPKPGAADRLQLVGVAWNNRAVQKVGEPFQIPIRRPAGADEFWRRHPWAMKLTFGDKKTDIVVVPLHMKSNRGGEDVMKLRRYEEAKGLVRAVGAVQTQFQDDDVVLIGDSNALKASEPGMQLFSMAGFRDLNAGDLKTWIKSPLFDAAPFDRVFVPDGQPEFKDTVQHVHTNHHLDSEEAFRAVLSDHYLIYVDVKLMDDDD